MATIVVESGSGANPSANSYVSEAELNTYASDRGVTLTESTDILLIKAMDYMESLLYIGIKYDDDQPLQWPRFDVFIDGYLEPRPTIPTEVKKGQMAVALAIDAGNGPLDTLDRGVKREKADVVEVEYMDNAPAEQINRTINAALFKVLRGGSGSGLRTVRV